MFLNGVLVHNKCPLCVCSQTKMSDFMGRKANNFLFLNVEQRNRFLQRQSLIWDNGKIKLNLVNIARSFKCFNSTVSLLSLQRKRKRSI